MLSKNVLLNWYSSMKKNEKDSDNFWHRKLTLNVKFWHFWALFDTSPLIPFSKFNNFLWVCWFLGKNIYNFVPPVWKFHNPYCHNRGHSTTTCTKFWPPSTSFKRKIVGILHTTLPFFHMTKRGLSTDHLHLASIPLISDFNYLKKMA